MKENFWGGLTAKIIQKAPCWFYCLFSSRYKGSVGQTKINIREKVLIKSRTNGMVF